MYIPGINLMTNKAAIIEFMKRFSFAVIITAKDNLPTATHLPFLVSIKDDRIMLTSHFAKANNHWKDIENNNVLVIFSEPHAYISPANYDKELNVPTWNYISVHAYGKGTLINEEEKIFELLNDTINNYEPAYKQQWHNLPSDYKIGMSRGIMGFEIVVTDLQAKEKLSQNRTDKEKQNIINSLSQSTDTNEQLIALYMKGV